jgi:branched-chain amino acid transport system permease protein
LAAQLGVETVVRTWSFTRGLGSWDMGWNFPDLGSLSFFYYLILGLLGVCLLSTITLLASRVGYALKAIHKDEVVAASVGVPTTRYKAIAFIFSAAWPGVLGAAYGPFLVFISPDNVFALSITLNMILITIFGGIGTVIGPILGGIGLSLIDQLAWANFLEYHHLIYGLLIVLVISFWPGGLVSLFERRRGGH